MANVSVFLSDMQAGRSSCTGQVRIRFWETRNVRRGGELLVLGVDMLLLDSQVA